MVFDLLWLDGDSLLDLPYLERRERLLDLELDGDRVKVPAHFVGEGTALLAASKEQQLEGIVAKRLDSRYVPGGRRRRVAEDQEPRKPGARDRRMATRTEKPGRRVSARC